MVRLLVTRVFISYSHREKRIKERLLVHLRMFDHQDFLLDTWEDSRLAAGSEWEAEISAAINEADLAILLVSADFLASSFIRDREVPALLRARKERGLLLIPVIAQPCAWQKIEWLRQLQVR